MTARSAPTSPIPIGANTISSFYSGAGRIGAFRGDPAVPATDPEDWVASATARTGAAPLGLTRLPDGTLLADAFSADPQGWFGPEHRYGDRSALLVKLLDAGRRLPLHVHPDRAFAREHLASDFGKAEAWLVLHADPGSGVHLGFSRDVSQSELAEWVQGQRVEQLLDACNLVPLQAGDVLFCPPGVPHAIGDGVLMVELQEMTDFSLMLEWAGYDIDPRDVFLGLASDLALSCVRRGALTGAELAALAGVSVRGIGQPGPGITPLLPPTAAGYFAAEQVVATSDEVQLDARFSVLVVNAGQGRLTGPGSAPVEVAAGQTFVVPYAAGALTLSGAVSLLRCYPA